jgi:beta-galactosidase
MARVSVVEGRGLSVDGTLLPLVSGTLHYWRHPPSDWPRLLKAVKGLGYSIVETYIPWGVHEIARKSFDFGGLDPSRNLEGFIAAVKKAGLKLIVRPGPHINAELTDFGYPRRIVTDPDVIAREAHGGFAVYIGGPRPFGLPSYASEKFYAEVALWFDAIAPVLHRNLHPDGPIVAVQVDNETGYFFRIGAYQLDYHPDSLAAYRRFLESRYGDVRALNETYGASHPSFTAVEPPRRWGGREVRDLPHHLDWQAYKERHLLDAMRRLRGMWVERGVKEVPFYQNYYGAAGTPFDVAAAEGEGCGLDVVGLDDYSRRDSCHDLAFKGLYLSGTSRLPYIPEFGAGSWAFPPCTFHMDERDTAFTAPFLFMFGVKAVNHYMLVERDRWMGSPLSASGEPRRALAGVHRGLNAFLEASRILECDLQTDLLLMVNRDADRLRRVLSLADDHPLLPWPEEAGLADAPPAFSVPPHEDHPGRFRRLFRFALDRRLPFRCADTGLPAARWRGAKALLLPSYELLSRDAQDSLRGFVEEGGAALLGPSLPGLDERCRPLSAFPVYQVGRPVSVGKGRLLLLEEWDEAAALAFLAEAGVAPLVPSWPEGVWVTRFTDPGREVVFAANPGDAEKVLPPFGEKGGPDWTVLYGGDKPWRSGKTWTLAPWTVAAFEMPAVPAEPEAREGGAPA